jgi:hypothetical protein
MLLEDWRIGAFIWRMPVQIMSEKMRHLIRGLLISLAMVCLCGAIALSRPATAQEEVRARPHEATFEEKLRNRLQEKGISISEKQLASREEGASAD